MLNRYPRSPSCFHAVIKPAWYAAISAARSVGGVSTGAGAGGTTAFVRFRVMIGAPSPGRLPGRIGGVSARAAQPARNRFGPAWSLRIARAGSPSPWSVSSGDDVNGLRLVHLGKISRAEGPGEDLDLIVLVYYCCDTEQTARRGPPSGDASCPRFELSRGRRREAGHSVTRRGGYE